MQGRPRNLPAAHPEIPTIDENPRIINHLQDPKPPILILSPSTMVMRVYSRSYESISVDTNMAWK